jgi:hypothetical protein
MTGQRDRASGDDEGKGQGCTRSRHEAKPNQRKRRPIVLHNSSRYGRRSIESGAFWLPNYRFRLSDWI